MQPKKQNMETLLMTRKQIATMFFVTSETVRNWERDGIIPVATRINGKPRYKKDDVNKLLEKGVNNKTA